MRSNLGLTIAVVLLLAGAVVSWWRIPAGEENERHQATLTLLTTASCDENNYANERHCAFVDDGSTTGSARRWTFLIGLVAAALLISAHAAPGGTRARRGLGVAAVVGSALALVLGLSLLCTFIWIAVELHAGSPGLGGFLFVGGAIVGLRSSRVLAAG